MTPTLYSLKAHNSQILYHSSVVLHIHLDSQKLQEVSNTSTVRLSTTILIAAKLQVICVIMESLLSINNKFVGNLLSKKYQLEQPMHRDMVYHSFLVSSVHALTVRNATTR
jgi:hypothetical protein